MPSRADLVKIAESILAGADVLPGARRLYFCWRSLVDHNAMLSDDDYKFLLMVDSELDPYPVGADRPYWAPDALREADIALNEMRRVWRGEIHAICERVVAGRF